MKLFEVEPNQGQSEAGDLGLAEHILPAMGVELFEAHLAGSTGKEFQQIVYKVSADLFDRYVEPNVNMRIVWWKDSKTSNTFLLVQGGTA